MRRLIISLIARRNDDSGQVLVLFALGLVVLCGAAALSVDAGSIVLTRRNLQNAADSAALAAVQDLPSQGVALNTATVYGASNLNSLGYAIGEASVEAAVSTTYVANDTVTVTTRREVPYTLGRALGLDTAVVTASATARVGYLSGGVGLQPWGLVADGSSDCISPGPNGSLKFNYNVTCRLKDGAPGDGGDFGALSMDASGADEYRENVVDGSDTLYNIGDKLNPETGNMVGPTKQGATDRLQMPRPAGCGGDSFSAVTTIKSDGSVAIREGCENHPRLILIPIVDQIDHQGKSTILGFAVMFLENAKNGQGGGHTEIWGRFITTKTTLPGAQYNGARVTDASSIMLVD